MVMLATLLVVAIVCLAIGLVYVHHSANVKFAQLEADIREARHIADDADQAAATHSRMFRSRTGVDATLDP